MAAKFEGGPKAAAELLNALDTRAQKRVMEYINKNNPELAGKIENHRLTIDHLQFLTQAMMFELLLKIDCSDLGRALRLGAQEVRNHFLKNLPKSKLEEVKSGLFGPPIRIADAEASLEKILTEVKKLIHSGAISF